jgi:mannan endo-1,4-beta-mannosidase
MERYVYRILSSYERGGIQTLCWHQFDPLGRSFYADQIDYMKVVPTLLPGGEYHEFYKNKLKKIARLLKALRGLDGHSIPIIFRPYHEHLGSWFWWGGSNCTPEEYNALWQYTVLYLRDSLNVHNLIYAISPSQFDTRSDYLSRYPGDDYVDILGMDHYFSEYISIGEKIDYLEEMRITARLALEKYKVCAITEVGQEAILRSRPLRPIPSWMAWWRATGSPAREATPAGCGWPFWSRSEVQS